MSCSQKYQITYDKVLMSHIYNKVKNNRRYLSFVDLHIKLQDKNNYNCFIDYLDDLIKYYDIYFNLQDKKYIKEFKYSRFINYEKRIKYNNHNNKGIKTDITDFIIKLLKLKKILKNNLIEFGQKIRNEKFTIKKLQEMSVEFTKHLCHNLLYEDFYHLNVNHIKILKTDFKVIEITNSFINEYINFSSSQFTSMIDEDNNIKEYYNNTLKPDVDVILFLSKSLNIIYGIKNPIFHVLFKYNLYLKETELTFYSFYILNRDVYDTIRKIRKLLLRQWDNDTVNGFVKIFNNLLKNKMVINTKIYNKESYILFCITFILNYFKELNERINN